MQRSHLGCPGVTLANGNFLVLPEPCQKLRYYIRVKFCEKLVLERIISRASLALSNHPDGFTFHQSIKRTSAYACVLVCATSVPVFCKHQYNTSVHGRGTIYHHELSKNLVLTFLLHLYSLFYTFALVALDLLDNC